MKVCVVGGTGNISTSVVRELTEHGHDVTCFNRGRLSAPPDGVRLIEGDRKDRAVFERTMQGEAFDAAIDMICFDRDDALSDIRAFRGVKHFIHVSTVCTYGLDYDWLPVSEDHPLRPVTDYGRNKVTADEAFLEAHQSEGFPVTILKPSTTYGPQMGVLRQIAWDFSWLDRVRDGRPILIHGDGHAIHQFLHVDDAAIGFANVLGREKCIGEVYNLVGAGYTNWRRFHETVMSVLGRTVDMIGVTLDDLDAHDVPNRAICRDIFAHNCYYSTEKLLRDVPEFAPRISLEDGIRRVYNTMLEEERIPRSEPGGWEDRIVEAVRGSRRMGG
jgi:nucleoside-diphosphate-sugar epimerase